MRRSGAEIGAQSLAGEMETVGFLQMTLAAREVTGWTGVCALRK